MEKHKNLYGRYNSGNVLLVGSTFSVEFWV